MDTPIRIPWAGVTLLFTELKASDIEADIVEDTSTIPTLPVWEYFEISARFMLDLRRRGEGKSVVLICPTQVENAFFHVGLMQHADFVISMQPKEVQVWKARIPLTDLRYRGSFQEVVAWIVEDLEFWKAPRFCVPGPYGITLCRRFLADIRRSRIWSACNKPTEEKSCPECWKQLQALRAAD